MGTPVDPEVKSTTAGSAGCTGTEPEPTAGAAGSTPSSASIVAAPGISTDPGTAPAGMFPADSTSAGSTWSSAASTSPAPRRWCNGAATAPMRQQARYRTTPAAELGSCQATTCRRRTPARCSAPATVATACSMAGPSRRWRSSTTDALVAAMTASNGARSHGPPGRR
ncbi:MAG TPA: hypothetical protein VEJ21_02000 [Acidimicrobiales bacterium]|nr:hypothetical protein [Acidimicrobiales bacterium]